MATARYDYHTPLERVVIRVDDNWYDLTSWRHSHPGGVEIIDKFHNLDASEAFYAVHSQEAVAKLHKMKATPIDTTDSPRDTVAKNFERFRAELRRDGYFDRSWYQDFTTFLLPMFSFLVIGTIFARTHPVIASILLGIGLQQAGWCAHDYIHGRGKGSKIMGVILGPLVSGLCVDWWNHKHSFHHVFPNRKEYDVDIHNEPVLHLWFPKEDKDSKWRKYQHLYYLPVFSLLILSWRMQSVQYALRSRCWVDRLMLVANYCWLATLPWYVTIAALLIAGFLIAVIVTCNHQTEPVIDVSAEVSYNFVRDQFNTTRGVLCKDPVSEYLFGGMQYQLEHHLFPFMPKAYFPAIRPLVRRFAAENGLKYHMSGVFEIFKMNFDVYKTYAMEASADKKPVSHLQSAPKAKSN